jgi:hypothetical protein
MLKSLLLFVMYLSLYAGCNNSLVSPQTQICGGNSIVLGDNDAPCCESSRFAIFDKFRNADGNISDENISTKVFNQGFDLNINISFPSTGGTGSSNSSNASGIDTPPSVPQL